MRILSGIQPSGALHLGNYFGMMRPAIELQERGEAFYFIADYHALTTVRDPAKLREFVNEVAIDFLACGLDPKKSVFFRQSDVPEVTELAWLLSCLTPMGLLERCHSYKDKISRGLAASHGLFAYPVLMAADILIYDSDLVPVGKDQKQHLEVARDIAIKVNEAYGEDVLRLPEASIREEVATVPGVDGRKMSKSYNNTIDLGGDDKALKKRIMSIVTDSTPVEAPKPIEQSLILPLYRLVAQPDEIKQMEQDHLKGGFGYGDFKKRLLTAVLEYFGEMREQKQSWITRPDEVEDILQHGAKRARTLAQATLGRVRKAVGLNAQS
ncbi:MAG: tryptophan--tRNA ligase [Verrucomicrobiales bacterium]